MKGKWLGGVLSTDIAAYVIDWSKIQGIQTVSGFGVFGNVGDARVKGVEAQATLSPVKGLNLSGNITYTDATISQNSSDFRARKGDPLPYTAKWTGAATADYETTVAGSWRAFGGAAVRLSSARYSDFSLVPTRVRLAGYGLVDVRAGVDDGHGLRLTLYVKNIADKRAYLAVVNNSPPSPRLAPVQPRTIGVQLSKSF